MENIRSISYQDYYEKVIGGWKGKCIAGTLGGRYEGWNTIFHFSSRDQYDPGCICGNDDVDVQLMWLSELHATGVNLTSGEMIKAFRDHYFKWIWNEYLYSQRNHLRGIHPPVSGWYANTYFKESEGCPIRAEIWGMIAPGNPGLAADYAAKDGCIDHDASGAAVYAEMFIASLAAEAFFQSDLSALINKGLDYVPEDCKLYSGIIKCLDCYKKEINIWDARKIIDKDFAHNDCSNAVYNTCVVVLALLYGGGDFDKTVTLALNGGADTDCTCATVGAVLGIINKSEGIPMDLLAKAVNVETGVEDLHIDISDYDKLTEATCAVGINLMRDGSNPVDIQNPPVNTPVLPHIPKADYVIEVNYNGLPEINVNEPFKTITVTVTNNTKHTLSFANMVFTKPGYLTITGNTSDLSFPPGKKSLNYDIALTGSAPLLETNNIIIHLMQNETDKATLKFGLIGAPVWSIIGPFREFRDYQAVPRDQREIMQMPWGETFYLPKFDINTGVMDGQLNYANVDEHYADDGCGDNSVGDIWEGKFSDVGYVNQLYDKGFKYSAREEFLKTNDMFGLEGACCTYAIQKLYMDHEMDVEYWTGSTDPWKMWVNGKMIYTQDRSMGYCDYAKAFKIHLNQGLNMLVVKIVRIGQREQNQKLKISSIILPENGISPASYGR